MSSFVTRTEQKIKEWWGAKITKDPTLEAKKSKINEIDSYIRAISQSYQSIAVNYQQMQVHYSTIAAATSKLFEKEIDTNKRIGIEVSSMFGNLSELFRSKVEATNTLNKNFTDWFQIIETLKVQLKYFAEVRLIFDHYKAKVDELQLSTNQALHKGQENFKLQEKLRRNQSKFSNAESTYNSKLSEILNNMNKLLFSYYKMTNLSLDQFIAVNFDLCMNAKSILKKNQKAFHKFKYPEEEPIIDLAKQAREMVNGASQIIDKKVQQIKDATMSQGEKDRDNQGQGQGQDKFNPFADGDFFGPPQQQAQVSGQQQWGITPQQNQFGSQMGMAFFNDDQQTQIQSDIRRQSQPIGLSQPQYNRVMIQSQNQGFVSGNPFSEQSPQFWSNQGQRPVAQQQMQSPQQQQHQVLSPFDDPQMMNSNRGSQFNAQINYASYDPTRMYEPQQQQQNFFNQQTDVEYQQQRASQFNRQSNFNNNNPFM